jgi:hypothetical protein
MYRSLTLAAALSIAVVSVATPAAAAKSSFGSSSSGGFGSFISGLLNFGKPPQAPLPPAANFGLQIARNACSAIQIPLATRICLAAIPEPSASRQ